MNEAPGPINFTMFLTLFGERLQGTDPEDVIKNAFRWILSKGFVKNNIKHISVASTRTMSAWSMKTDWESFSRRSAIGEYISNYFKDLWGKGSGRAHFECFIISGSPMTMWTRCTGRRPSRMVCSTTTSSPGGEFNKIQRKKMPLITFQDPEAWRQGGRWGLIENWSYQPLFATHFEAPFFSEQAQSAFLST